MNIKVKVGTTTSRQEIIIDNSLTIKQALEQAGVDYSTSQCHLDGSPLTAEQMNKSFADISPTADEFRLVAATKSSNS